MTCPRPNGRSVAEPQSLQSQSRALPKRSHIASLFYGLFMFYVISYTTSITLVSRHQYMNRPRQDPCRRIIVPIKCLSVSKKELQMSFTGALQRHKAPAGIPRLDQGHSWDQQFGWIQHLPCSYILKEVKLVPNNQWRRVGLQPGRMN